MTLEGLSFYSFFTKYSLMEEYGFSSGIINRLYRKLLPSIPDADTVEYVLLNHNDSVSYVLSLIDFTTIANSSIAEELNLSIQALCTKVVAFGLDSNIKSKYSFLKLNSKPFEHLLQKVNKLSEYQEEETLQLINSLEAIELLVTDLRKNKHKIGTNFHLTLTTRRILEYTDRIKQLLHLKANISSKKHWEKTLQEFIDYSKYKDGIRRYIGRHSDLVVMEMVEHNSTKGQKYIAETHKEYWHIFFRSLLGGGIIAVFAFFKLIISYFELSEYDYAFWSSVNYALCFIIVNQVGGIIATKQPAMTATTLAKNIYKDGDVEFDSINNIITIVRRVFRSQFISVIGNFLMAIIFACLGMLLLKLVSPNFLSKTVEPQYLINKIVPGAQTVLFASIAGFFLALSGIISGYVDNKVIVSKVAHRIRNNRLLFKNDKLAAFIEKKSGVLMGNISLGFFLGSSFLLSNILPFQIDIRHVAFSSANVGYAIMNFDFSTRIVLLALMGALLIGLVNFIVSFSVTFYLALKSRKLNFELIPKIIFSILKDILIHPLHYFIKIDKEPIKDKKISGENIT